MDNNRAFWCWIAGVATSFFVLCTWELPIYVGLLVAIGVSIGLDEITGSKAIASAIGVDSPVLTYSATGNGDNTGDVPEHGHATVVRSQLTLLSNALQPNQQYLVELQVVHFGLQEQPFTIKAMLTKPELKFIKDLLAPTNPPDAVDVITILRSNLVGVGRPRTWECIVFEPLQN